MGIWSFFDCNQVRAVLVVVAQHYLILMQRVIVFRFKFSHIKIENFGSHNISFLLVHIGTIREEFSE